MLWIKSFHIVFVVSWFAGLFYLPRLFVNLALDPEPSVQARLIAMAGKLYRFMHGLAILAVAPGLWLWLDVGIGRTGPGNGWMHAKLALVLVLIAYHVWCGALLARFRDGRNVHSHVWFRWFNEIPTLALFLIVPLVVVKPF